MLVHGIDASISREENPKKLYAERADAMLLSFSVSGKGLLNVHAKQRASEPFNHQDFLKLSYFDRWLMVRVAFCIETSVFSEQEWQAKRQQVVKQNKAARQRKSDLDIYKTQDFLTGQMVLVKRLWSEKQQRLPFYLKGKVG